MSLYSGHIFENTKVEVILIKMFFEFILIKYFFRTEAPSSYFKHFIVLKSHQVNLSVTLLLNLFINLFVFVNSLVYLSMFAQSVRSPSYRVVKRWDFDLVNSFHATGLFRYPLKTSENLKVF